MRYTQIIFFLSLLLLVTSTSWAQRANRDAEAQALQARQLDSLRREVEALRRVRAERLDRLEQLEAARWQERYRQNRITRDHQEEVRAMESRYSRRAGDLGRVNDELVSVRNASRDLEDAAREARESIEGLEAQVGQVVERITSDLSADFPVGMENRALVLGKAREALSGPRPRADQALQFLFTDLENRYSLTLDQILEARVSTIGESAEVPVWRLRMGTVFLAELERDGQNRIQALLRTGALQGRVFEWRSDLSDEFRNSLAQSVLAARGGESQAWIPIDVLQNRSMRTSTTRGEELSWQGRAEQWFRTGGAVMYPLVFVALLAILLGFERWLLYFRRGRINKVFLRNLEELVGQSKWKEARELCFRQSTSLGQVMYAVINHGTDTREAAEKSLREAMLRETPFLEKRLSLISALGSSAPLLGLLGTVSGMITLFKVITEVGTNDARILAGGISEALITTQTGLVIAIPILLLHGYLAERLDAITSSLSVQSMAMLNKIWPDSKTRAVKA